MNIKDLIALADTYAPSAYADMQKMDWGVLFWDDNNPTQHDANHACILNDALFEKALVDIQKFYLQKEREQCIGKVFIIEFAFHPVKRTPVFHAQFQKYIKGAIK